MSAYVSKYSWRSGYSYKTSADTVGKALAKIEERDGSVTSKAFLEYSRPEESETHSMFEWDDSIAAEKYRLSQSGRIINQLQIEIVRTGDSVPTQMSVEVNKGELIQKVSAFVNVMPKSTRGFATFNNTISALNDKVKRDAVLANAMSELESFMEKYQTLDELSGVIESIKEFKETQKGAK